MKILFVLNDPPYGTCMDARGIREVELIDGATRSTLDELARASLTADKVLVF